MTDDIRPDWGWVLRWTLAWMLLGVGVSWTLIEIVRFGLVDGLGKSLSFLTISATPFWGPRLSRALDKVTPPSKP